MTSPGDLVEAMVEAGDLVEAMVEAGDLVEAMVEAGWQQIRWEAARRRCCRPVWSSTSSRARRRARRTLDGQQLDDGLAGGPDSSSGEAVKLVARGGRMVVGWGRCGRTVAQTQVLRAGVPWSSRAGLRGSTRTRLARRTKATAALLGPDFHTFRVPGLSKVLRLPAIVGSLR